MSAQASPYPRDNYYGEVTDEHLADEDRATGHVETDGTDPPEYVAFSYLSPLLDPICRRHAEDSPYNGGRIAELFAWLFDGEEIEGGEGQLHRENKEVRLSEPELWLPKQAERDSRIVEYRQHRHRRRYNPETGYINWGETTSTGLPEFGHDVYDQAVANYLYDKGARLTEIEEYERLADQFWHDPQYNSFESFRHFVEIVREREELRDS